MNRTITLFTYEKDEHGVGTGKAVAVGFNIDWLEGKIAPMTVPVFLDEYTYDDVEQLLDLQQRERSANEQA